MICIYCGKQVVGHGKQVYPGKVPGATPIKDAEGNYTGRWQAGEIPIPEAHKHCPKGK